MQDLLEFTTKQKSQSLSFQLYLVIYAANSYDTCICHMRLVVRKPVFGVSDQVPHKPGCADTEDGERLEISDLGSRGIVLSV